MKRVVIVLLPLFIVIALANSIAQDYSAIRLLLEGKKSYEDAKTSQDTVYLNTACDQYQEFYSLRDSNPALAVTLEKYFPVATYDLGWCFYRLAELSANPAYYDSARTWFDISFRDINREYDNYRRYMQADAAPHRRWEPGPEYLTMYDEAASDNLSGDRVNDLMTELTEAGQSLTQLQNDTSLTEALRLASVIRGVDSDYEKAMLRELAGDTARARQLWDEMDYRRPLPLVTSAIPAVFRKVVDYCQTMVLFRRYLHTPVDSNRLNFLNNLSLLNNDSLCCLAHLEFIEKQYDKALQHYRSTGMVESLYWMAYTNLIFGANGKDSLRFSRRDFAKFVDSAAGDTMMIARLRPLVREADKKRRILDIALGDSIPGEFYDEIDRPTIRFLMQIGAATQGDQKTRCLEMVKKALLKIDWLSENERTFYLGIVKTMSADAEQIPENRPDIFREAAKMLRTVHGEFEAEAKYVRARCLVHAYDLDEAEHLLKELVRDYGSVRALYYLAECYRSQDGKNELGWAISSRIANALRAGHIPTDYQYVMANVESNVRGCSSFVYENITPDIPGIDNLHIPESLSVIEYSVDGETVKDLIKYETLREGKYISQAFHDEVFSQIVENGTSRRYLPSNICYDIDSVGYGAIRIFDTLLDTIPDTMPIDDTWDVKLMLIGIKDNNVEVIDSCNVFDEKTNRQLHYVNGYYMADSIKFGDTLHLCVKHPDYYPYWKSLSYGVGTLIDTFALTEKYENASVDYHSAEEKRIMKQLIRPDSLFDVAYNPLTREHLIIMATSCMMFITTQIPRDLAF